MKVIGNLVLNYTNNTLRIDHKGLKAVYLQSLCIRTASALRGEGLKQLVQGLSQLKHATRIHLVFQETTLFQDQLLNLEKLPKKVIKISYIK